MSIDLTYFLYCGIKQTRVNGILIFIDNEISMNKQLNEDSKRQHENSGMAKGYYMKITETTSWGTFEACVPPDQVLATLEASDFGYLVLCKDKGHRLT